MAIKNLSFEIIKDRVTNKKNSIIIISEKYTNKNDKADVECSVCGYEWKISWRKLSEINSQNGCPCCLGLVVSDKNRVSLIRPDLIKYFKDEKESDIFSVGSHKKVTMKCPNCGEEKVMMITDLTRAPFSCKRCSDGISRAEKYMYCLLNEIGVEFQTQKKFEWLDNRYYDFYIPSKNLILELMGGFHFRQSSITTRRTLKEEQENDIFKKEKAIENGISSYLQIDCRNTTFKGLKTTFIKELKDYFVLENIDFSKCFEYSSESFVKKSADLYNEGKGIIEISKILNKDRKTISNYINTAKNLNIIKSN